MSDASGVFNPGAIDAILGTELQQIWLDHLLALAMLQHKSKRWTWARFVVVHPEKNPSFDEAGARYVEHLQATATFSLRTIESLLDDGGALPGELRDPFVERYLW